MFRHKKYIFELKYIVKGDYVLSELSKKKKNSNISSLSDPDFSFNYRSFGCSNFIEKE